MISKERLEEIRKLANTNNSKEKLTFEIHARPMVWELLSALAAARADTDQMSCSHDTVILAHSRTIEERDEARASAARMRAALERSRCTCAEDFKHRHKFIPAGVAIQDIECSRCKALSSAPSDDLDCVREAINALEHYEECDTSENETVAKKALQKLRARFGGEK